MDRTRIWAAVAAALVTIASAHAEEVLENPHVLVRLDAARGGVVTQMLHRHGDTFPYYGERGDIGGGMGAGIAGKGAMLGASVRLGERWIDLTSSRLAAAREPAAGGGATFTLRGEAEGVPGLRFERRVSMAADESGFRVADRLVNDGAGAITLSPGGLSEVAMSGWMSTVLTGVGDAASHRDGSGTMDARPFADTVELSSPFYWRMVSQWGVGLLWRVRGVEGPVRVTHERSLRGATAVRVRWEGRPVTLPAGQALSIEQDVLIDQCARRPLNDATSAATLAEGPRVLVTADLRRAALPGDVLPGAATVVSAIARRATLRVTRALRGFDGATVEPEAVVREVALTLPPGRAVIEPIEVEATARGVLRVGMTVVDEAGAALASTYAESVVDGDGQPEPWTSVWQLHQRRLPEHRVEGTWREIGIQLVRAGTIRPAKVADAGAAERLAFYRRRFPHYAELIEGASADLQVAPERLAQVAIPARAAEQACMDVFFDGPDGPINAFSKERFDEKLNGLGYIRVRPSKGAGYAYHMYYMPPGTWEHGYGINSQGLSTSGASLNADKATEAEGERLTQAWRDAGKPVTPIPMHTLLSTCATTEEALALIEDPESAYLFDGSMLIVDRAGHAARVESVGLYRQVHRFKRGATARDAAAPYFVAGNYAHDDPSGAFKAGGWSLASNTMLREAFLCRVAPAKMGELSLRDVFALMETHAAGGMCQHIVENRARLYTSTSFIAVCRTGDLWLSAGPPCQVRYVRYTLEDAGGD